MTLQLLSLAFDQNCVDVWSPGTIESRILCTADFASIDTIDSTSSWQDANLFDAVPVRAAIAAQSAAGIQKQSVTPNPDHQLPEPVGYDPAVSISDYNHELDGYISAVWTSR
jgi:hypothetical protein